MSDMIDQEKFNELVEKAIDALRPLGLTVEPQMVAAQVDGHGHMMLILPALVRPDALERKEQDDTDKEFQQMMAAQAQERIKAEKDKVANITKDPEALLAALFNDEPSCEHPAEQVREGLCLACMTEIP